MHVIADLETRQLPDTAASIGQDGEHGAVADTQRSIGQACVKHLAAVQARHANGLAVHAAHLPRRVHKVAVGRVRTDEAIALQIGEQRADHCPASGRSSCWPAGFGYEVVAPRWITWSGRTLPPAAPLLIDRDAAEGHELLEVTPVVAAQRLRGQ